MKLNQISDRELLLHYRQGNEACLEMLIRRHKRKIFTSIYMIVNDRYIAEDIFQETFIKVVNVMRSNKYKEEDKFLPWVMRIARNMSIDYFRKKRRNVMITGEDGEDIFARMEVASENKEDEMINKQTTLAVRQLINMLPEEQKMVLVMRQYAGMSFKEIAAATDVSINTALGRMRYALTNLRKLILEKELNLQ